MKAKMVLAASAVLMLTAPAMAEEKRVERKQVCTCTVTDGKGAVVEEKMVGPGGPAWESQDGKQIVIAPHGGAGDDVDVQVFNDGKTEKRIVIVRSHGGHDSADENKDGKVTRKEFLARAEKHFAKMDRDNNGALEKDEMHPPMPPMPPGVPPIPPVPPVPPAPPVPPTH